MLTVGVPTIRPNNLLMSLPSLLTQLDKFSKLIIVNSSTQKYSHLHKLLFQTFRDEKIPVNLVKSANKGIGKARAKLIDLTKTRYLLTLDDDVIISNNTLDTLLKCIENQDYIDFVVPMVFNPRDEMLEKKLGKSFIPFYPENKEELNFCNKISLEDNYFRNMFYSSDLPKEEKVNVTNTFCIILDTKSITNSISQGLKEHDWGEDRFLTKHLNGLVTRRTHVWHLLDIIQDRRWNVVGGEVFDKY